MQNVLMTERNGVPVYLRDVADVHEGSQPRLGQVGVNHDDDAIEGIVLLQRGEQSIARAKATQRKSERVERRIAASRDETGALCTTAPT